MDTDEQARDTEEQAPGTATPAELASVELAPEASAVEIDEDGSPLDLAQRFLCSDGACIGTIGAAGRCKLCDAPISPCDVTSFERVAGISLGDDFERLAPELAGDASGQSCGEADSWDPGPDEPPDLDSRVLCVDGNCIGVVGPDNACKVCGVPAAAEG